MSALVRNLFLYPKCCFHTSCISLKTANKLPRVMGKFLQPSAKKKKWYDNGPVMSAPKSLTDRKNEHARTSSRRVTSLNKLFMRHITDQMSSGEIGARLFGHNIEISEVQMSSDFGVLNIFWMAKGTANDESTESVLDSISYTLRHQLSQLKIIGNVPKIQFVKDRKGATVMELELKLAVADFGEDFVPTDRSYPLRSDFILKTQLSPQVVEKIRMLDSEDTSAEIDMPPISTNIYGLDRESILKRIMASKQKSKQAWMGEFKFDNSDSVPSAGITPVKSYVNEKEQFKIFLKKRQIEVEKSMRQQRRAMKASVQSNPIEIEDYMDEYVYEDDEFEQQFVEQTDIK